MEVVKNTKSVDSSTLLNIKDKYATIQGMRILSGSSNEPLAQKIAEKLKTTLVPVEISTFPNGEKRVWISDSVKGETIAIVQSFSGNVDSEIIEFLLLADALERGGARHVHAIIPWMGYSLQDKVFRAGEPIAAKVVANLVSTAFIKRVQLLDLHNTSIPGFFSIPTQHLSALELFVKYSQDTFDLQKAVVVSPDFGGLKRARVFADSLNLELANIDKTRHLETGIVTPQKISGEVEGKTCLVFDDVINTGSTVKQVAQFLKEHGASNVHFIVTHGLFAGPALSEISDDAIDSIVISNSILHQSPPEKINTIDVSILFSDALNTWN